MKNIFKKSIFALPIASALAQNAECADVFGRASAYYDTRGMPTYSVTLNVPNLPLGSRFFGFTDFFMNKEKNSEFEGAYGEYQLSRPVWKGLGVSGEYNRNFSLPSGVHRLGVFYEPNLSKLMKDGFFGVTLNAFATQHDGAQLVFYGGKQFKKGDMYLDGFLDYNFKSEKIVTEVEFGKRIYKNLFGVVEFRHNGFQKNDIGLGLGLAMKF